MSATSERRSAAATAGSMLAIATTAAMAIFLWLSFTKINQIISDNGGPEAHDSAIRATVLVLAIVMTAATALSCAALIRSNGLRITAALLGLLTAGLFVFVGLYMLMLGARSESFYDSLIQVEILGAIGAGLHINHQLSAGSATTIGVLFMLGGAIALIGLSLLFGGNRNGWYTARSQRYAQTQAYSPPAQAQMYTQPEPVQTPSATPAGWYPTDGGVMRWWDGDAWTEHVHDPSAPQ